MGILQEIKEIELPVKGFVISVLTIAPFWYLSLYLFANEFVKQSPIEIPIIVTYCISLVYFILNFAAAFVFVQFTIVEEKINVSIKKIEIWVFAALVSVLYLSIFMFFWYIKGWGFSSLVLLIMLFTILRVVVWIGRYLKGSEKNTPHTKQSKQDGKLN